MNKSNTISLAESRPTAPMKDKIGAVLVCGGGVAGIEASLDLAESGFKVYLLDSGAAIGGRMAQLDMTFPTGDCATCVLSPKLVECARNRNIEIITLADITGVEGCEGHFKVRIRQNPRYVDAKKCDGCGDCATVCPVNLPNPFDLGLGFRKAIDKAYPQAIPGAYSVLKAMETAPCKRGCPAGVNIPGAVSLIKVGKIHAAYNLIRERNPFPASCGRVCSAPCQTGCRRSTVDKSVSLRALECFVGDFVSAESGELCSPAPSQPALEAKIAVVGGGPAGLTAAGDLASMGYRVTVFEARPKLGGMLQYGIPTFRLSRGVVDREIEAIVSLGVEVKLGTRIPFPRHLLKSAAPENGDDSSGQFDAVFVSTGAWSSRRLGIPGEDAPGVWGGLSFLQDYNDGKTPAIGPRVLVLGSSRLAVDAARAAIRLPGVSAVRLACMEAGDEMEAPADLVAQAVEEGVEIRNGLDPTRIETEGEKIAYVAFRSCTSVYEDYRGYKRLNPIFDDTRVSCIPADTVIVAVGWAADGSGLGLELRPGGKLLADKETLATPIRGVFAGGDAALGPTSVAEAIAQGHLAAKSIDAYIRGIAAIRSADPCDATSSVRHIPSCRDLQPTDDFVVRSEPPPVSAVGGVRRSDAREGDSVFDLEQAKLEAGRCLACGICSECMECVRVCGAGAIEHEQQPREIDLEVGSIIFAPGFKEFDASRFEELGYGRFEDIVTGMQFERMLAVTGPTGGRLLRPSCGAPVRRIAFVQCAGSRNEKIDNAYCSAVCCMAAAKQAVLASEHGGESLEDIAIFCSSMRSTGTELDGYIRRAVEEHGVRLVRAGSYRVSGNPQEKCPQLSYSDADGTEHRAEFDLIVLGVGMRVPESVRETADRLGLDLNEFGFARTNRLCPVSSSRPGIFVAGAFQEPKDISESVSQGAAAAACVMERLNSVRGTMTRPREYPWERDVGDEPPRIGVFVCGCGRNISAVVDVDRVAHGAAGMDGVVYAGVEAYACSDTAQQKIKALIKKFRLNRLVMASCSSPTHEVVFQETLRESGLNRFLLVMTDIRDHCAWVHRDMPEAATAKAVDLVAMAVARAHRLKAQSLYELPVNHSALVLGGGLAGMTAALSLADQGYGVHLVEKSPCLGGMLRNVHTTLEGIDVQGYLDGLIDATMRHSKISVHLRSVLTAISGQAGSFVSTVTAGGKEIHVEHGVVIVATGGCERFTTKYLHGKDHRVVSQSALGEMLAKGRLPREWENGKNPTVVMIQCVESRDEKNPYCSRVCCAEALKNALEIKRRHPGAEIFILGRDIRISGFREGHYRKALAQGVRFIRADGVNAPSVLEENGVLTVIVRSDANDGDIVLRPDLLVLSVGASPAVDNPEISRLLRVALTAEGFFQGAHPKLSPVNLMNVGQFICGWAHSPRFIDETIAQAKAAAARASIILSKSQREIMGRIAWVEAQRCVACATCVRTCPFGAPRINGLGKSEIQGAKCLGCGSCTAACPSRAILLQHQESEITTAMLHELLVGENA